VNHRLPIGIFLVIGVSLVFWTSSASARFFSPAREIFFNHDGYTITYSITDPVSGVQTPPETWAVDKGFNRNIIEVQSDNGILTWTAVYSEGISAHDPSIYEVHFRIYDPGRGVWKAGSWAKGYWLHWTPVANIYRHNVNDGVVTWTAYRPSVISAEHTVFFATYDPEFGSWVQGQHVWWAPLGQHFYEFDYMRVKNGVAAWVETLDNDPSQPVAYAATYDHEIHNWEWCVQNIVRTPHLPDRFEIPDDTAQLLISYAPYVNRPNVFFSYDPHIHQWSWVRLQILNAAPSLWPNRTRGWSPSGSFSGTAPRPWMACLSLLPGSGAQPRVNSYGTKAPFSFTLPLART
jgi:hypothetical protein